MQMIISNIKQLAEEPDTFCNKHGNRSSVETRPC